MPPRQLAQLQAGERERVVGYEFSLRDEYHPRHREHEHQRRSEQRLDCAIAEAVLDKKKGYFRVHVWRLVSQKQGIMRR